MTVVAIEKCLCTQMHVINRFITGIYNDQIKSTAGITAQQFTLLSIVAEQTESTACELGRSLCIEKSTLSRNLSRLEGLGYIAAGPPRGRHGITLSVTAEGREMLEKAQTCWHAAQKNLQTAVGPFGVEEIQRLHERIVHAHESQA